MFSILGARHTRRRCRARRNRSLKMRGVATPGVSNISRMLICRGVVRPSTPGGAACTAFQLGRAATPDVLMHRHRGPRRVFGIRLGRCIPRPSCGCGIASGARQQGHCAFWAVLASQESMRQPSKSSTIRRLDSVLNQAARIAGGNQKYKGFRTH